MSNYYLVHVASLSQTLSDETSICKVSWHLCWIDWSRKLAEEHVIVFVQIEKCALILQCKHLEFLMQVLNVDGIKFGNTKLILPPAKFSSMSILLLYGMLYISISCLVDCYTLSCVAVCFYWRKLFLSVQWNIHCIAESCAVESMYYGCIGSIHKCPDYQVVLIIQFSLHATCFVTITKRLYIDYAGVLFFKYPH